MSNVWEHVREGARHFPQPGTPPPRHPVRQFILGLSLPFHLVRALRTDAQAWKRYLRVSLIQSLVILGLGLTCTGSANEAVDTARERVQEAQRARAAGGAVPGEPTGLKLEVSVGEEDTEGQGPRVRASLEPDSQGELRRKLEFWAALFTALQIAQWVVIALSRGYHDAISRDASLLSAIEPEDEPLTPDIRLDLAWVGKKISRRIRAFIVFLVGLPVLFLFTVPWSHGDTLLAVLVPLWSAYWLVVFTTAKTARAWEDTSGRVPWFLRGWTWLTTKVPGFRWGFLQAYGRFWANRTRSVFSPAVEWEKQPWGFAGLAVIRALAILPVFKCFLRPLIPVAAAHLMRAQRAVEPTASPEPSALPGTPATGSSASAA